MVIGPEVGFTLRLGVIGLMREDGPSPFHRGFSLIELNNRYNVNSLSAYLNLIS